MKVRIKPLLLLVGFTTVALAPACRSTKSVWLDRLRTGFIVPFNELSTLVLYGTPRNAVFVLQFGNGSGFYDFVDVHLRRTVKPGDVEVAIEGKTIDQSEIPAIRRKIIRLADGTCISYLRLDDFDPEKYAIFYVDEAGRHKIPYKGISSKRFQPVTPQPLSKSAID